MKIFVQIVVVAFALVGLFGVALVSYTVYLESPQSHFATYNELVSSRLIDHGWLPSFLPRSVTDILEAHDIDNNSVWATFKYDIGDTKSIREACKIVIESENGTKYLCPPFEKGTTIIILKSDGTGSLETDENEI